MATRKLRRWRDRGAAAVEFALVMPLLVVLLLGIAEFGYAFSIQAQVAGVARVAVRDYAINWTTATAATAKAHAINLAESNPPPGVVPKAVFKDTLGNSECTTASSQATLRVTYQYHSLTGLFNWLGIMGLGSDGTITVTGTGSMACGG